MSADSFFFLSKARQGQGKGKGKGKGKAASLAYYSSSLVLTSDQSQMHHHHVFKFLCFARERALINQSTPRMMILRKYYHVDKEVDTINLKFAEAREEIESAMESKETVYFNEEAECAREAVTQVVELYKGLLNKVTENERGAIQRSMGLKIQQLKAELGQLDD